jgi:hypothetical protein
MKTIITSLVLLLTGAFSFSQLSAVHEFYVQDMSNPGYDSFSSITVNEGDQIYFYNGAGGTYNFWVVDDNNWPAFEVPGVMAGQLVYSVTIDANYPSYNNIRVEKYEFSPSVVKQVEIIKNTASVEEKTLNLRVYPNPTSDQLNFDTNTPVRKVSIYGLDGKLINSYGKVENIDVSYLNAGTYIVRGTLQDGTLFNKKFIKK